MASRTRAEICPELEDRACRWSATPRSSAPVTDTPLTRKPRRGDEFELELDRLDPKGTVVGMSGKFQVAVRHTVPGSTVRAQVIRRAKDRIEARALEVLSPSPDAVEPRCPHAGTCGGCAFQGYDYARQLEEQRRWVAEALTQSEVLVDVEVEPVLAMDDPWHYRNKMDFTFANRRWVEADEGENVDQSFALGLHVAGQHRKVLDVQSCSIAFEAATPILNSARKLAREMDLDPWDLQAQVGLLRHLVLRHGVRTNEILVDLVVTQDDAARLDPFAQALLAAHPEITTMVIGVTEGTAKSSIHSSERVVHGAGVIHEELAGLKFTLSASSFFQTNTVQAERLIERVRDAVDLQDGEVLYDLYCGTGTLGLALARPGTRLLGFEVVPSAVEDARKNAAANGVQNATFVEGDVRVALADVDAGDRPRPDVIVVDPPRAGLHPAVIPPLVALNARRIVYVSCNVASAARDLRSMCVGGYRLTRVQPVDLFPHTAHLECVFTLDRIAPSS